MLNIIHFFLVFKRTSHHFSIRQPLVLLVELLVSKTTGV